MLRRVLVVLSVFIVLSTSSLVVAQEPQAVTLPDGLLIPVKLVDTVSVNSLLGTPLRFEVTADVKDRAGVILLPKGATLKGRLTKASAQSKDSKESVLSVIADEATWENSHAALNAYIVGKMKILNSKLPGVSAGVSGLEMESRALPTGLPKSCPACKRQGPTPSSTEMQNRYMDRAVDRSVRLRMSPDPQIVTEVYSSEHDVQFDAGSTFTMRSVAGK